MRSLLVLGTAVNDGQNMIDPANGLVKQKQDDDDKNKNNKRGVLFRINQGQVVDLVGFDVLLACHVWLP